jgi:hypothetical protein
MLSSGGENLLPKCDPTSGGGALSFGSRVCSLILEYKLLFATLSCTLSTIPTIPDPRDTRPVIVYHRKALPGQSLCEAALFRDPSLVIPLFLSGPDLFTRLGLPLLRRIFQVRVQPLHLHPTRILLYLNPLSHILDSPLVTSLFTEGNIPAPFL